jgi:pyrroline-5-carboxylate reductase
MGKKLGFIGAGNMATAIINGVLKNQFVPANMINVYYFNSNKIKIMAEKGINTISSGGSVVEESDIVILAVKPQNYQEVLGDLKDFVTEEKVFVSIAAGISIKYVQKNLGCNCPLVRVMPNTPLLLGKGATALCPSANISAEDFDYIKKMFSLNGTVEVFAEEHMNEIIAVNGSSPAYVYLFAKAMADYAKECGIDSNSAMNLIIATLEGSAAMLRDSGDDPDTLIKKVSSPGGTTLAALNTLDEYKFYEGIKKAMESCTNRAEELGK